MPDWAPGVIVAVITSILAPVVVGYFSRRKNAAAARYDEAQAGKIASEVYRDTISTLRAENAGLIIRLGELEVARDNDRQVIELLSEQKVAATTHNQALTARIAEMEGRRLYNEDA